jgi:hypothetical protein
MPRGNKPFARAVVYRFSIFRRYTWRLHFPWVGFIVAAQRCFGVIFALTLLGKTMLIHM